MWAGGFCTGWPGGRIRGVTRRAQVDWARGICSNLPVRRYHPVHPAQGLRELHVLLPGLHPPARIHSGRHSVNPLPAHLLHPHCASSAPAHHLAMHMHRREERTVPPSLLSGILTHPNVSFGDMHSFVIGAESLKCAPNLSLGEGISPGHGM